MPSMHTTCATAVTTFATPTTPTTPTTHTMDDVCDYNDDHILGHPCLHSQFDSDSEDDFDDVYSTASDASDADSDATDDITMLLYDVPEVVITPPADRDPSFFRTSPDMGLLDAEPWDFPATLSALLDPVEAPSLCAAACTNPSFRQRVVTTIALARKYGLRVPDVSVLDNAWTPQRKTTSSPVAAEAETPKREPAARHVSVADGSSAGHRKPCLKVVTATTEFIVQPERPLISTPSTPTIVITPATDDSCLPPFPPTPIDTAFLDAVPWDLLAYRRALAQPAWADTLESRALADPRLARQLAHALAVARGAGIELPTAEERRAAREEAEARRRAMAEEWARTCAQQEERAGEEEMPVPRRWKAGRGRGRLPTRE
jgi:hypothetical protein